MFSPLVAVLRFQELADVQALTVEHLGEPETDADPEAGRRFRVLIGVPDDVEQAPDESNVGEVELDYVVGRARSPPGAIVSPEADPEPTCASASHPPVSEP